MAEQQFVTVYHPTLPDTEQEVPAKDVDAWADAGWLKGKSKVVKAAEANAAE